MCSNEVTHVVSEGNPAGELWAWLQAQAAVLAADMEVLDISWFTESMRAGRPVSVESRHRIQVRPGDRRLRVDRCGGVKVARWQLG